MIYKTISIQEKGSLLYARVSLYLWDSSSEISSLERPMILICPGGAYARISDREAEPVALKFMSMGYHTAILRYSCAPAEYPTALRELGRAIVTFRENAKDWKIDKDKIIVMGFSAGGHLAASYGVFWNEPWLIMDLNTHSEMLRPNGMMLCYPVITSDKKYWHEGSFRNLLGKQYGEEMLEKMSLENRVGQHTPKTFLWHTCADGVVPVENSFLWVQAMCNHCIPVEFHMYEKGPHGLSLANELSESSGENSYIQEECQSWVQLAEMWLKNL